VQPEDFKVIATHAVDGDVVLVQDQFSCAGNTAWPAHTGVILQLCHRVFQLQHKLVARRGLSLAMNPAISSTASSAVLVHFKAIDQAPYLANTSFT
jgi:hypothetical protein